MSSHNFYKLPDLSKYAPTVLFTRWIAVYLSFCGILLVYSAVIVLRAWINQRTGSTYLTISILLGILVFGYDVYAYEGSLHIIQSFSA